MFNSGEIVKAHDKRAKEISFFIVFSMGILLSRLVYLQIFRGDVLLEYSLKNRLREEVVWAPRGKIFDRNGKVLVDNAPRFDAVIIRQYLKDDKKTISKLASILGKSRDEVEKTLKKNESEPKYRPITIKKNIDQVEIARLETESDLLPGVRVQMSLSRKYTDSDIGAHVLGYVSEITSQQISRYQKRDNKGYKLGDFIGQSGIEQRFDPYLRGVNGREYVQVDALGRMRKLADSAIFSKGIEGVLPEPGNSLVLTLDEDLQKAASDALGEHSGSLVAIDVKTGEILAMVSSPSYLPSEFSRGLDPTYWNDLVSNPENPLRDRVIQEHYSPGSTFKPFVAIAGLAEGFINEHTEIHCDGGLRYGGRTYHCWKKGGHGTVNLEKAIRESCNVYFLKLGMQMDIDDLAHYANLFGLGKKTGVNIPRETSGLVPTKEWKVSNLGEKWQKGETLSCAIGQSFTLATTMQLAVAYAAIANRGTVIKPYVVKEVLDKNAGVVKTFEPEVVSKLNIADPIYEKVIEGLFHVVNHPRGTTFWFKDKGTLMAGKTGTAQVKTRTGKTVGKCEDMPYKFRHHGIFAGFLPANNPRIALASVVEHGCHGNTAAAPVVVSVAKKYMQKYYPEEYKENIKNYKEYLKEYGITTF